jgi:hypothetical protein
MKRWFTLAAAALATIVAALFAATALAAPAPVQIGGPTAADWVANGAAAGITVGLVATPANEAAHTYAGGADNVFDATDRDTIGPTPPPGGFGLGVDNTLISNGMPGVTSHPSEIGYYGNAAICGEGMVLANNCADQLAVTLSKALYGGSFDVTFLYGPEQSGESLKAELYRNGVLQDSTIYGPVNNGSYPATAGEATFTLPNVYWDEIRFIGNDAGVADATDFLVESISGLPDRPEFVPGATATGAGPDGTQILNKGSWFMYNTYDTPPGGEQCFDLQAGNPKMGINIVGQYCITPLGGGQYEATYHFDPVTIGGFEYQVVVLNEHLAISDTMDFTAVPGQDDNQDFGVPFSADGNFYVFAHFSIGFK